MDGSRIAEDDLLEEQNITRSIILYDGQIFDPVHPNPKGITRENLIPGLANMCRFGGQVKTFYSVGQHSVLVAALTHMFLSDDLEDQKAALLHDGDECFGLPDLPKPVKVYFPDYVEAQHRLGRMVFEKFCVDHAREAFIKPADIAALEVEKRELKKPVTQKYWTHWQSKLPEAKISVRALTPQDARGLCERAFERVFDEGRSIDPSWLIEQPGFYRM